ncbi:FecR domain-containing protein [Sphingosinicella sp. LHD-64]|uniref:FecR family protein n=1 Tax=Sphingosinicella sp. LHD-64 TaxID=3072139 RepID=UPI00280CE2EB|nr:FecR domain-containing protein [Sphingosinicella sp. LHD-64]MDQ8756883.1 FecR domain-containing protein [Sphingosinicella sp. LHD-64]
MTGGSGSEDDVEADAASWAVRIAERPLTEDEQQQFDQWLADSSRHLGAYVRAQAIWADASRVAALDDGARRDIAAHTLPIHWGQLAMAASVAMAVIGGAVAHDQLVGRVTTSRDEVRRLVLDDGSVAVLNGNSTLQVRYDDSARRVVLRRGEAQFEVRHGDPRPFLVNIDDTIVRAVGTRFAVGFKGDEVEVTVAEGEVAVLDGDRPAVVRRNERLVTAATGARCALLDTDEVERRLRWQPGLHEFQSQSLRRAAHIVNGDSRAPVTAGASNVARAEFVDIFRAGDDRGFTPAAAHLVSRPRPAQSVALPPPARQINPDCESSSG